MGRRQVVRLWILVPPFKGSSPFVPDFLKVSKVYISNIRVLTLLFFLDLSLL